MTESPFENIQDFIKQEIEIYGDQLAVNMSFVPEKEPINHNVLPESDNPATLASLEENISQCLNCSISNNRTSVVLGEGKTDSSIAVINSLYLSQDQDNKTILGGKEGELFDQILKAIKLKRNDVYLLSLLKCPLSPDLNNIAEYFKNCKGFFKKQLHLIKPKFILGLGENATLLLDTDKPFSEVRGKWFEYEGYQTMFTHHPSVLLNNVDKKRETWHDVKIFKSAIDNYSK